MSIQEVTMYRVACDHDGCGANASEGGEYVAWADRDAGPYEDADGAGWQVTPDGDYCPDHVREGAEAGE
jgi:hypothetical protein